MVNGAGSTQEEKHVVDICLPESAAAAVEGEKRYIDVQPSMFSVCTCLS